MTITIRDHHFPTNYFKGYEVEFFNKEILTVLTSSPYIVDGWISKTEEYNQHRLENLVVGLDVEWRPNTNRYVQNPVAILQLYVGPWCLIYQLMYTQFIPDSLVNFLRNPNYIFVGVGVENDVQKLDEDYGLKVCRFKDLRELAFEVFGAKDLRNAGLKGLTSWVLGMELDKPKCVTMSRWDEPSLALDQVAYASVDAFLSSEIGRTLIGGEKY